MIALITKHSTVILMTGLGILLLLAWVFPAAGLKLGIAFLLWTFLIASLTVLEKHKTAYRKGELTRGVFIRNATLEIGGTFLVMTCAGLLGRQAAELAAGQMAEGLLRAIAGIGAGLVVGIAVGILGKKTLRRLVDTRAPG